MVRSSLTTISQPQPTVQPEKTNRIWDFLVLWPIIHFFLFVGFIGYAVTQSFSDKNPEMVFSSLGIAFMLLMLSHVVTAGLMLVLFVYSIHRLYTRTSLPDSKKKSWLILILFFHAVVYPFLHFKHLRK